MAAKKKGMVTIYMSMFLMAVLITVVATAIVPAGIKFNAMMYAKGEEMIIDANETIQSIGNDEVRSTLTNQMNLAQDPTAENIGVMAAFYRYSWLLIVGVGVLIVFMWSRRNLEFTQGFI